MERNHSYLYMGSLLCDNRNINTGPSESFQIRNGWWLVILHAIAEKGIILTV